MTQKHTPAPWRINQTGSERGEITGELPAGGASDGRWIIALLESMPDAADTALIEAAPRMYEALATIIAVRDEERDGNARIETLLDTIADHEHIVTTVRERMRQSA